jgi:plastocyanin
VADDKDRADEHGRVQQVVVLDNCDPTTFNGAFGPGICLNVTGGQGVPLPDFLAALPAGHPQWLFYPATLSIKRGDTVRAVNQGGEIHTFTEVEEFGGGFIPALNDLPDSPAVPECAVGYANISVASTRLIQGSSLLVTDLHKGVHRFVCCIHPWMRLEIEVK